MSIMLQLTVSGKVFCFWATGFVGQESRNKLSTCAAASGEMLPGLQLLHFHFLLKVRFNNLIFRWGVSALAKMDRQPFWALALSNVCDPKVGLGWQIRSKSYFLRHHYQDAIISRAVILDSHGFVSDAFLTNKRKTLPRVSTTLPTSSLLPFFWTHPPHHHHKDGNEFINLRDHFDMKNSLLSSI